MSWLSRGLLVARRRCFSAWSRGTLVEDVLPRASVVESILHDSSDAVHNNGDTEENGHPDAKKNNNGHNMGSGPRSLTDSEDHEFEFREHATETSGESLPRIWSNNPCK